MFFWLFSGGNDYYRELNEQDYDMMLDDTPRGMVMIIIKKLYFVTKIVLTYCEKKLF